MACSLPWLSILLPQWLKGPGLDCECYMTWVLRDITNWLSLPSALLLQVHVAFYLGKMGVSMEDWLRIFALTKVQTLISILIWLPVPLSLALTDCCNWLPIALIFILILVNVYVYFIAGHSFCTWRVQKDSASPAKPLPHVPQLQTEQVDVESDPISLDASVLDVGSTDKCSTFSIWKILDTTGTAGNPPQRPAKFQSSFDVNTFSPSVAPKRENATTCMTRDEATHSATKEKQGRSLFFFRIIRDDFQLNDAGCTWEICLVQILFQGRVFQGPSPARTWSFIHLLCLPTTELCRQEYANFRRSQAVVGVVAVGGKPEDVWRLCFQYFFRCILYLSYMFDIGSAMYDSKLHCVLISYIYICSY